MSSRRAEHYLRSTIHTYAVPVSPKSLRETMCVAQFALAQLRRQLPDYNAGGSIDLHLEKINQLIDECDRKRPLGPDGKHDRRHTGECGCEQ